MLDKQSISALVRNLLLMFVGVAAAFSIVEVLLRWVDYPVSMGSANPYEMHVGWAMQPNERYILRLPDGQRILNEANSLGLRDQEHTYAKQPGTFRILILGDSFVAAHQVLLDDAFHQHLQEILALAEPPLGYDRVEVIAAGASGWGTDNELLYFRHEGYRYDPDLVVTLFVPNDVPNNYWPLESRLEGGDGNTPSLHKPYFVLEEEILSLHNHPVPARGPVKQWLRQFRIYRPLLEFKYLVEAYLAKVTSDHSNSPASHKAGFDIGLTAVAHPHTFLYLSDLPGVYENAWGITVNLLEALRDEVEATGAKFVVISATNQQDVELTRQAQIEAELAFMEMAWDWDAVGDRMNSVTRQHNIPYLNLVPIFRQADRRDDLHIPGDGHWSVEGHRLAAEAIADWFVSQSLWVETAEP